MADKVALEIEIGGVKHSIELVKDLKKAINAAKSELLKFEEGTDGFKKAQKNISELSDKLDGIGDSAKIQGTGVERLHQSFGLLTQSLGSADLGKAKLAFVGIGQAMSAIPIFLLIEGITQLIQNFDEAVKFFNSFTDAAKAQEKQLRELSTAINSVNSSLEETKYVQDELSKNTEYYTKIAIEKAKQRGASERELNKITIESNENKLKLIKEAELRNYSDLLKAGDAYNKALRLSDDEALKKAQETFINAKKAYTQSAHEKVDVERKNNIVIEELRTKAHEKEVNRIREISEKRRKQKEEDAKLADETRLHAEEEIRKAVEKENEDFQSAIAQQNALLDKQTEDNLLRKEKAAEAERAFDEKEYQRKFKLDQDAFKQKQINAENEKKLAAQVRAASFTITKQGLDAAQNLTTAYFNWQINKAKGDEAAQLELKKKSFNTSKAFAMTKAGIDGYQAALSAYAGTPGGPVIKGIAAGVAGLFAASQIAMIASTTFDGGESSAPSAPSVNVGGGQSAEVPNITPDKQAVTLLDNSGKAITQTEREAEVIKAYLVTSELDEKQKNSRRLKEQSRF